MTGTTRFGLPYMDAAASQKSIDYNEALPIIDALLARVVEDYTLTAPPATPGDGLVWAVPSAATGLWSGQGGDLAIYTAGGWVFKTPPAGVAFFDSASGKGVQSNGTGWSIGGFVTDAPSDGKTYFRKDAAWVTGWPYDFRLEFAGTPLGTEVMGKMVFAREVVVAADFAGSAGSVGVTPTAAFAIDVRDDGVSIGAASIATDGTFTFTTVGGSAKTIAAGSEVTFVAPAVDATIMDIIITFVGVA